MIANASRISLRCVKLKLSSKNSIVHKLALSKSLPKHLEARRKVNKDELAALFTQHKNAIH